MVSIKYISASLNPSGYGEAARKDITALFIAGVNVTCETISQMSEITSYSLSGDIRKSLEKREIPYKVVLIHLTPDLYPDYKEDGNYNIGRLFWETDHLPKKWVDPCNELDEIWTASEQQAEMIRNSGVITPIYCFAQPIDISHAYENIKPFTLNQPKDFIFYACFQWILRKNPKGLLQAYWKEFTGNKEVTLLIKTYGVTYIEKELQRIRNDIELWKKELKLEHLPKIYLVHKVLTDKEILRFHNIGDVFINPSSGEGWNRVMQEAMLLGKPVISGNNGGITDIMTPRYYHKVDSHEVQAEVSASIPWYTNDMKWKQLDENSLRKEMRNLYEQKDEKAKLAQQYIVDNFSYQTIGNAMKQRLEAIVRV